MQDIKKFRGASVWKLAVQRSFASCRSSSFSFRLSLEANVRLILRRISCVILPRRASIVSSSMVRVVSATVMPPMS